MSNNSKKTSAPSSSTARKRVDPIVKEKAKAVSAATATGLTGRTVLLPTDDMDEYVRHLSSHHAQYLPADEIESELVQTIADCGWRLRRIPNLEAAIFNMGQQHFADEYPEESPEVRRALIQAQTYITFERQFNDLFKQEHRLHREKDKAVAALQLLKKNRPKRSSAAASVSASSFQGPSEMSHGFEYSA